MYDPTVGKWMEEDPIQFKAGDANLRRYVSNDPTNATDPSGLQVASSIADEDRGGTLQKKKDDSPTIPLDITLTIKGTTPTITKTNPKPGFANQDIYDNPWVGRSGASAKCGDIFLAALYS